MGDSSFVYRGNGDLCRRRSRPIAVGDGVPSELPWEGDRPILIKWPPPNPSPNGNGIDASSSNSNEGPIGEKSAFAKVPLGVPISKLP